MTLPHRKQLPHELPLWIKREEAVFFFTFCCHPRNHNHLAHEKTATAIFESVRHRHDRQIWFAQMFLLMPDHAHALISFPPEGKAIRMLIKEWKAWTAKRVGVSWQRDFFEHRLRGEENRRNKADYIGNNPVRAGLVQRPEDWPYVWFPP